MFDDRNLALVTYADDDAAATAGLDMKTGAVGTAHQLGITLGCLVATFLDASCFREFALYPGFQEQLQTNLDGRVSNLIMPRNRSK